MAPDSRFRPALGGRAESEITGEEIGSTVRRTADSRRNAMLAGLELSYVLHRLAEQPTVQRIAQLQCANRCGALLVEQREAYARRKTCPCREAS